MIDFRYHIVSLVAVFLALTVGLVLGSTVLEKPVIQGTRDTANELDHKNAKLRDDLLALQSQQQASEKFVQAVAPGMLAGRLKGERVVLVQAPGASDERSRRLFQNVRDAGGQVSGTVALQPSYLAKKKVGVLGGLTDTLAKTTKTGMPDDAVPAERAAILLSHALVTTSADDLGKSDPASTGTLNSFKNAHFLTTDGSPAKHASLAILVGPAQAYGGNQASNKNNALVALAKQLDSVGNGSVLAGPTRAAGSNGVVAALRADDEADEVSSVDDLDAAPGRVTTVLALALESNGKSGQWGIAEGADGVAPTPAPHSGS
ncbi:MAG: copper transporter [Streptosporangiales bacterium]